MTFFVFSQYLWNRPEPLFIMSRFFHGGGSDSETSSSDEEELYSDHEAGEDEAHSKSEESSEEEDASDDDDESSEDESKRKGANRFFKNFSESEESGDEDRQTVVKSAKDKRLEELEGTIKLIENAEKINDWAVISAGECCPCRTFLFMISDIDLQSLISSTDRLSKSPTLDHRQEFTSRLLPTWRIL